MSEAQHPTARLAQSAERKALNLVVVGSSPTVGVPSWLRPQIVCKLFSLVCALQRSVQSSERCVGLVGLVRCGVHVDFCTT